MASNYSIDVAAISNRLSAARVLQLADDNNDGAVDTAIVDAAIASAEDELEGYANPFYAVPLRTSTGAIPKGIRTKLVDLASWWLMQRNTAILKSDEDEGDYWDKRRTELLNWMEGLADGDSAISIADAVEAASSPSSAELTADTPTFTKDRMAGFF